ncbi:unnamed protein product [Gongylonema pulchrum]|uniref:DUF4158 domain-containing protein n=1 Tax=Gongylonema pulchrum TaxID=637853 RepID=A0A183ECL5_9BILA|nr:unnamed protein product [Gongylonema pulchrum]
MGLSTVEAHRVARITEFTWSDLLSEIYHTPRLIGSLSVLFPRREARSYYKPVRMVRNLEWLSSSTPLQFNNPNLYHLLYFGFGNARSLAELFQTVG